MKNLIIIFITQLLLCLQVLSQENYINKLDDNGRKTGYWKINYPDGKIKYEGYFLNDKPVGEFKRYYPGGILQALLKYSDNSMTANAKLFYENGKLAAEGKYIIKEKDSTWNYYSSFDEKLIMKENYIKGKRNGESTKFYDNMSISERIMYINDKREGVWEQFYYNGSPRLKGTYVNDKLDGEFDSWTGNGKPSIKGIYKNGLMHGKWIYFNEKGEPEMTVEYNYGTMIPNEEMERRKDEFSKKVQESIGNYSDPELPL